MREDFHHDIESKYPAKLVPYFTREKKLLGNMDKAFINKRCGKLQRWLDAVSQLPNIFDFEGLKRFLEADLAAKDEIKKHHVPKRATVAVSTAAATPKPKSTSMSVSGTSGSSGGAAKQRAVTQVGGGGGDGGRVKSGGRFGFGAKKERARTGAPGAFSTSDSASKPRALSKTVVPRALPVVFLNNSIFFSCSFSSLSHFQ